jgi:hypothetical protein
MYQISVTATYSEHLTWLLEMVEADWDKLPAHEVMVRTRDLWLAIHCQEFQADGPMITIMSRTPQRTSDRKRPCSQAITRLYSSLSHRKTTVSPSAAEYVRRVRPENPIGVSPTTSGPVTSPQNPMQKVLKMTITRSNDSKDWREACCNVAVLQMV